MYEHKGGYSSLSGINGPIVNKVMKHAEHIICINICKQSTLNIGGKSSRTQATVTVSELWHMSGCAVVVVRCLAYAHALCYYVICSDATERIKVCPSEHDTHNRNVVTSTKYIKGKP